ncbi:hypothetical protein [Lactiplantibacillus daowaiensis]|uniref:Uncharacterized protein n=1 Tax=Lactiplantibacillus daowaiensis TaxID=2559918 RepID=A0ABW1S0P8_9LACO|nr:hypothetical protein [Lactiplantibacillus daowaiensis]
MPTKLTKIKPVWIISIIGVLIVLIVGGLLLRPKKLNGSYSAEISILFTKSKDTLKFTKDNKVAEYADGEKTNTGHYKIDGDKLTFNLGDVHVKAKLASDHKSFTLGSGTGIAGMAKGLHYTLDD